MGKGAASNEGYRAILEWGAERLYQPENVIVVVFDSDSQVPSDFLQRVTPYFDDPKVVGVQSAVRMHNRAFNPLTSWQHLEFSVWVRGFSRSQGPPGECDIGRKRAMRSSL